jgi:hypothetical protein
VSVLRRLNTGKWNKPPVLTGARLILATGLAESYGTEPLSEYQQHDEPRVGLPADW